MTWTVANLKGGTGKTTTTAYLAHGLPGRVMCVDADPPGSLLRWSELGEWTLPVIGMPTRDIHTRLKGMLTSDVDHIVIDTPPLDGQSSIVHSALRAADVVVVPVSPSTMELDRLTPILDAVEDVEPLRASPLRVRILLSRVVTTASSGGNARDVLTEAGLDVMRAQIPRREVYAGAFGGPVVLRAGDPYAAAVEELLEAVR